MTRDFPGASYDAWKTRAPGDEPGAIGDDDDGYFDLARLAVKGIVLEIPCLDDGTVDECSAESFLIDNKCDREVIDAVLALGPGETVQLGGGACPVFVIRRKP